MLLKEAKLKQINELNLKRFYKRGEWHDFEINGARISLKVIGTSNLGLLLLEDKDGKQQEFDLKEEKWVN